MFLNYFYRFTIQPFWVLFLSAVDTPESRDTLAKLVFF